MLMTVSSHGFGYSQRHIQHFSRDQSIKSLQLASAAEPVNILNGITLQCPRPRPSP